eukprot:6007716-Karenia_brevis.AAC.1
MGQLMGPNKNTSATTRRRSVEKFNQSGSSRRHTCPLEKKWKSTKPKVTQSIEVGVRIALHLEL